MTDYITVKTFGEDEVRIVPDFRYWWSWRCNVAFIISVIGSVITGILLGKLFPDISTIPIWGLYLLMILPGFVYLDIAFLLYKNLTFDLVDGYYIYLKSSVSEGKWIIKTDIASICKTIKEYERIAQVKIDGRKSLEAIVERCK